MFTQLAQLLRAKTDTFTVTAARESDTELRVVVTPRLTAPPDKDDDDDDLKESPRRKLNKPLVVIATPAELDAPEFLDQLTRYAGSATGLRQSLDEIEAEHKAVADEEKKKSAEKKGKGKPAAKVTAKPAPKKPSDPKKNPLLNRAKAKSDAAQVAGGEKALVTSPVTSPSSPPKSAEEATQSLL